MRKFLIQLGLFLVAVAIVTLSFFFEYRFSVSAQNEQTHASLIEVQSGDTITVKHANGVSEELVGPKTLTLISGDSIDTKNAFNAQLVLTDRSLVRLDKGTELNVVVDSVNPEKGIGLTLNGGRIWFNGFLGNYPVNILAGGSYIIPHQAIVSVAYDGTKTDVYAKRHHATIGLVTAETRISTIETVASKEFINSFLLIQGNQTTIYSDKIEKNSDILQRLLYSKLVKEFPSGLIDAGLLRTDSWLKLNIDADDAYFGQTSAAIMKIMRERGLKNGELNSFGFYAKEGIQRFSQMITFFPDKALQKALQTTFTHLHDAEYLVLFGLGTQAQERLDYYQKQIEVFTGRLGEKFTSAYLKSLKNEYSDLAFVLADDVLYTVKLRLVNNLFQSLPNDANGLREKFYLNRQFMSQAFDLADKNSQLARQSLEDYYKNFVTLVTQQKQLLPQIKDLLAEENQIMNQLFIQSPQFYQDRYFAMKLRLEQEWLNLLTEGEDKNEEKQTIVSVKIDFLRQLKTFFLTDKVLANEAKLIVFRLFREIDDLQLSSELQVAVSDLFAQRLNDFGVFFRYLNSPEYVGTTLHGNTRQAQFDAFLQAQQEQVSIDQVRREILGDVTSTDNEATTVKIIAQVQQDFAAAGLTDVGLGELKDLNQRLIAVQSATYGNTVFSGQYDWDQKLLSQVSVNGGVVSAEAVRLNNLPTLFAQFNQPVQPQTQTQIISPETPDEPTQPISKTDRVAKILIQQKLKAQGVIALEADIQVKDLALSQFIIQKAQLTGDNSTILKFDLDGKQNVVTNLQILVASDEREIPGPLPLAELVSTVKEPS